MGRVGGRSGSCGCGCGCDCDCDCGCGDAEGGSVAFLKKYGEGPYSSFANFRFSWGKGRTGSTSHTSSRSSSVLESLPLESSMNSRDLNVFLDIGNVDADDDDAKSRRWTTTNDERQPKEQQQQSLSLYY